MVHNVVEKETEFDIIINLNEYAEDVYLPMAYSVSLDQDGYLAHIKQRAMEDTIGSFGLDLTASRRKLFEHIDKLELRNLEKKFSPPRRKTKTIQELVADKKNGEVKRTILDYIHRHLDAILTIVVEENIPLTWNVERKVLVKDFLMDIVHEPLQADLSFKRTPQGVLYRLKLNNGQGAWRISSREVVPITNNPAWLFVDYKLYKVAHINGFMVKPFSKRDEISIPQKQVRTYFQKFIVRVAAQVDIDANGFDVIQHDELQGVRVDLIHNVFTDSLSLNLRMIYLDNTEFDWYESRPEKTFPYFSEPGNGEDDVKIFRVIRDRQAEERYLDRFSEFGVQEYQGKYFTVEESLEDPYFLLEWLVNKRKELEAAGFTVSNPDLDQRELSLQKGKLSLKSEKANDWFDIFGTVTVGEFSFPFMKLAKHIREDNRFYPLPDGTHFIIPLEWMNRYKSLVQFGRKDGEQLKLSKSQFTILQELGIEQDTQVTENLEEVDFTLSSKLKAELRPYQLEGVKWLVQLYRNELGGCLADDMGLGKTLQTIAMLLHAKEQKEQELIEDRINLGIQGELFSGLEDAAILQPLNALIILPASLVFNWESEINKFAPHLNVYKHVGPKRHKDIRILKRFDVILTTYQTALRDADILEDINFEYMVLDESQQIKNRESKVFKAINRLQPRHALSLSGTPIENSLSDLWSQMQVINPNLLGSYAFFKKEFITPIEKHQDEEKKQRLRGLVNPYMLRRTKEEVAKDLPPLSTKIFFSEMSKEQRKLYEKEKSAARNYLLENYDENNPQYRILVLQSLTKLRQIVNHPRLIDPEYTGESSKFTDIIEHWDVIRRSGHKALFFSSFVQYLSLFREQFNAQQLPHAWLTGALSGEERERELRRFESQQEVQSFLISIKSGGTGLNLTAADYVFILDPWWNPTTEQQAIARAHRIGQDKNVIAVKFITKDSIEEKILKLQRRKSRLAEDIIENVRKTEFSRGDIEYLLE